MSFCTACGRGFSVICPTCDSTAAETDEAARREADPAVITAAQAKGAPWHFWLVVVAAAGYLVWRAVEGVAQLVGWLFG